MTRSLVFLAAFAFAAQPLVAQQSVALETKGSDQPQVIVPWRHFGPQPGEVQRPSNALPARIQSVAYPAPADTPGEPAASPSESASSSPEPSTSSPNDPPPETSAGPSPQLAVAATVANLSADYEKREQDRSTRRQELEAAGRNDPTLEALTDIQTTRLLLEGEQDRMQSTEQVSKALADLATKLQSDRYQVKALLKARRQTAEEADAEIARVNAETPDLNVTLKNLAMLPQSSENDEWMVQLSDYLDHLEQVLKTDQERSQQAHLQITGLEADERELDQASQQARAKAATFDQASEEAKLNQDLLANRLEFSVERKRASDELATTSLALQTSINMRGNGAVQQSVLGDSQPRAADRATDKVSRRAVDLRDCIRRTGDVTACRAGGVQQP